MSVTFVYRSPSDNPGCRHVRRFDADTVLEWFRSIWQGLPEEQAHDHADRLIGRHVYCFGNLFREIGDNSWPPPRTISELAGRLQDSLYVCEMKHGAHHVEVLTDDDELEMTISVFDDHYLAKHPQRAAFLAREDWRLPDGSADGGFRPRTKVPKVSPKGRGVGATYLCLLACYDSGSLSDLEECQSGVRVIPGVRLPGLVPYLLRRQESEEWEGEMENLRTAAHAAVAAERGRAAGDEAALLAAVTDPADALAWPAYSDWSEEHGRPAGVHLLRRALEHADPAADSSSRRKRSKDELLVQTHIAQACLHEATWEHYGEVYHHWVLFDDLWAAAHPDLAHSLLRFASRWDVL